MKPAGFWIRFFASTVDCLILTAASWLIIFAYYGLAKLLHLPVPRAESIDLQFIDAIIYMVISFFYYTHLHYRYGATLGKMPFQIKVLDDQTDEYLTYKKSMLRTLGYAVSTIPLMAGYVMAAFQPEKKALHEIISRSHSVIKN